MEKLPALIWTATFAAGLWMATAIAPAAAAPVPRLESPGCNRSALSLLAAAARLPVDSSDFCSFTLNQADFFLDGLIKTSDGYVPPDYGGPNSSQGSGTR